MNQLPGITLVGLGPGDLNLITKQVWDLINSAPEIYLRTTKHPVVKDFPASLKVISFDEYYDQAESFELVYRRIVDQVIELGQRAGGVIYAVPGHPFIAEKTSPEIFAIAKEKGIPVRVFAGISFIEAVFGALGIDPFPQTTFVDAFELAEHHFPKFPPDVPTLITQIHSNAIASDVKLNLMLVYPETHPVKFLHAAGADFEIIEEISLYEIDRSEHIGLLTTLYVPALEEYTSLESLQEIVARLRAPNGCPWDQEQTYLSLRKYLMEEAFEALSAIDAEDTPAMAEEFGDLLLQVLMQIQIAAEQGDFTIADVASGINQKLIRRHPHVFGDLEVSGVKEVAANWESIKRREKLENDNPEGALDSIPNALPALAQSNMIQKRVARFGFDWPDVSAVFNKVQEELFELENAHTPEDISAEMGDLLFVMVRLADKLDVEPEIALREANARFRKRFSLMERYAEEEKVSVSKLNLEQLNLLWERAKSELEQSDDA